MKKVFCIFTFIFIRVISFAEEKDIRIVPILNYEFFSVEQQKYHLPGGSLILLKGDHSPSWEEEPDNLMIGAVYKSAIINQFPLGYPSVFHYIDLIAERKIKRHFIQGLITSYSDKPFYGGLHTAYSQVGYGYELIRKEKLNLTLGLALGISDYGFDLPNGGTWPLLPLPVINFNFNSRTVNLSFTWPELKITLAPENRFRITGTVKLDIYKFRDIHDMQFDAIIWYRFFNKDFAYGDFAGAGLGIKNSGIDFTLSEKGKFYAMNSYSVFGILDASLLTISGGYIFYSRELYEINNSKPTGKGWFISVQALYQF
jgi:hypothetical protein